MKQENKIFELKFSKDRKAILSLSYPKWMNFFIKRFCKLRIYKPIPAQGQINFNLKYKNDGTYRHPVNFEQWMDNYFNLPNVKNLGLTSEWRRK